MALFAEGENVSSGWVDALDRLLAGDGEAVNLTVAIADPTTEIPAVRAVVDAFIEERRRARRGVERVSTVANTIFRSRSTSSGWAREPRRICTRWSGAGVR